MATNDSGLSPAERAAVKERAAELRAQAKAERSANRRELEREQMQQTVTAMTAVEQEIVAGIEAILAQTLPGLLAKTWYSQPAWARDGKVICFLRSGSKDAVPYTTFGISEHAPIPAETTLWYSALALTQWSEAAADQVRELLAQLA